MPENILVWKALIAGFAALFTEPTFRLFREMITGWVLCPGRHTVTRIYQIAEPEYQRSHDEYHRFFPDAAWVLTELWRHVAVTAVNICRPSRLIPVDIDDTVFHKTGHKVDGAGWWRDAVRSTKTKVVHCFGLNLIILTFRVNPPRGGEPLGLPINMRLHRKKEESLLDLARQMLNETATWFPGRNFLVSADGFFATSAGDAFFDPNDNAPQTWKINGPERAAAFSFIVYSLTWIWFIQAKNGKKTCWPSLPWYRSKSTPSFQDLSFKPTLSPCIDAGTNQAWMVTAKDLDGKARIQKGIASPPAVDMGAYETLVPSKGTVVILR